MSKDGGSCGIVGDNVPISDVQAVWVAHLDALHQGGAPCPLNLYNLFTVLVPLKLNEPVNRPVGIGPLVLVPGVQTVVK